ncbi:hypothetical protein HMPREF3198_02034 [Winkia neuii]|nr:hypothetical protein HMPREF3198_02034 [Winkia neuii]
MRPGRALERLFPARAGVIPDLPAAYSESSPFPRASGGNSYPCIHSAAESAFSPRERG